MSSDNVNDDAMFEGDLALTHSFQGISSLEPSDRDISENLRVSLSVSCSSIIMPNLQRSI